MRLKNVISCSIKIILLYVWCSTTVIASPANELHSLLATMHSLEATFFQKIITANSNVTRELQGDMKILKPGNFYWHVTAPDESVTILTDNVLLNFDADLEQVTIQNVQSSFASSPLSEILTKGDLANLNNNFKVSYSKECSRGSSVCFQLTPKQLDDGLAQLLLGFHNNAFNYAKIFDNLGQQSEIIFSKIKLNTYINKRDFEFKIPAGVDVIREQ